ncbi:MAG: hypothetical protein IPH06_03045 [Alphaproteobacteria bacterium]|nr:hypothetical protein [Alphaproteobacteria bacterium]QQS57018.1 MAG: hypothetical protein IPN28_12300 [Alphaproteobacteria bacterium]
MAIQLGKRISGGGTGAVHEGPDDTVYKITRGDSDSNADLMREFHLLSKAKEIQGLQIQQVLDAGRDGGRCYMQFRRIHGEPLGNMLMDDTLTREQLRSIKSQIAAIFDKLGENGFFHGDPEGLDNYIISGWPENIRVTLVDFVEGGLDPSGATARVELQTINGILDEYLRPNRVLGTQTRWTPA